MLLVRTYYWKYAIAWFRLSVGLKREQQTDLWMDARSGPTKTEWINMHTHLHEYSLGQYRNTVQTQNGREKTAEDARDSGG